MPASRRIWVEVMTNVRVLALIGVMAGAPGCGASGSDGATEAPVDQAAIDEEIASVTAALGEATCATTAADAIGEYDRGGAMSPLAATYDHPTCLDAFCNRSATVQAPAAGDYKIVASSGQLFGPKKWVTVQWN